MKLNIILKTKPNSVNKNILLNIDYRGVSYIKKNHKFDVVTIFLVPPSIEIMKKADVILCTISSGIGLYLDLMCHNKVINCDV